MEYIALYNVGIPKPLLTFNFFGGSVGQSVKYGRPPLTIRKSDNGIQTYCHGINCLCLCLFFIACLMLEDRESRDENGSSVSMVKWFAIVYFTTQFFLSTEYGCSSVTNSIVIIAGAQLLINIVLCAGSSPGPVYDGELL